MSVDALVDEVFDDDGPLAQTLAVFVVHKGDVVVERYAPDVDGDTTLISWSMAKSILHAAVGILVGQGKLDPWAPAPIELWSSPDDPRGAITLDDLLAMRDGLAFVEDYVDDTVSDVIEMLFGGGKDDMATFAADRPLAAEPGTRFNYSSGTSNIVSRIVADAIGGGSAEYETWLRRELFEPLGMHSAIPKFDSAGTFVASSFVYATARDFAKFGQLYLHDGVCNGRRILPEGWVEHGVRIRSQDEESGNFYGAHWWVVGDDHGSFWASGYEGQSILVSPGTDLVAVRLGKTPAERYPELKAWRARLVDAFT